MLNQPLPNKGAAYSITRNDERDVFEVRDNLGDLVATVPVGNSAAEMKRQEQVRDLLRSAPFLLAIATTLDVPADQRPALRLGIEASFGKYPE